MEAGPALKNAPTTSVEPQAEFTEHVNSSETAVGIYGDLEMIESDGEDGEDEDEEEVDDGTLKMFPQMACQEPRHSLVDIVVVLLADMVNRSSHSLDTVTGAPYVAKHGLPPFGPHMAKHASNCPQACPAGCADAGRRIAVLPQTEQSNSGRVAVDHSCHRLTTRLGIQRVIRDRGAKYRCSSTISHY